MNGQDSAKVNSEQNSEDKKLATQPTMQESTEDIEEYMKEQGAKELRQTKIVDYFEPRSLHRLNNSVNSGQSSTDRYNGSMSALDSEENSITGSDLAVADPGRTSPAGADVNGGPQQQTPLLTTEGEKEPKVELDEDLAIEVIKEEEHDPEVGHEALAAEEEQQNEMVLDPIIENQARHAHGEIQGTRYYFMNVVMCCRYARGVPCGFIRPESDPPRCRYCHEMTNREIPLLDQGARLICERMAPGSKRHGSCIYHSPSMSR